MENLKSRVKDFLDGRLSSARADLLAFNTGVADRCRASGKIKALNCLYRYFSFKDDAMTAEDLADVIDFAEANKYRIADEPEPYYLFDLRAHDCAKAEFGRFAELASAFCPIEGVTS